MPLDVVGPVALFALMGIVFGIALWRVVSAAGAAKVDAQRCAGACEAARRADACIGELVVEVDGLRRRQLDPEAAAPLLQAATAALSAIRAEVKSATPRSEVGPVAALGEDLDRAIRSLALLEHGRQQLARGGLAGEGETSVKRGYLNLLHARDAIRERAEEIGLAGAPQSSARIVERRQP